MASSSKATKTDLLVRVRYQNPLPPPPFPPRLLHIPTDPSRYSNYEFLTPLHNERDISMILDNELGVHIELGKLRQGEYGDGEYWTGNRSVINPRGPAPPPHEDDLFMLGDVASALQLLPSSASGNNSPLPSSNVNVNVKMGERVKPKVSWLRNTEYLSSEAGAGRGVQNGSNGAILPKAVPKVIAPVPAATRQEIIENTFLAANLPLASLQHPSKKNLVAMDSWELLPDVDLWPSNLQLIRFGEDPGEEKTVGVTTEPRTAPDPRLTKAILRSVIFPVEGPRLAYYLPESDEVAVVYSQKRSAETEIDDEETFEFRHIRDYQVASTRELESEYIFSFEDSAKKRVCYAPVNGASTLRKRRPRPNEDATIYPESMEETHWHGLNIAITGVEALSEEEQLERRALIDEVTKPPRLPSPEATMETMMMDQEIPTA